MSLPDNFPDTADRAAVRHMLTARRNALAPDERLRVETTVRDRLFALPAWREARLVCGYMPIRGELDLLPVWREAVRLGKTYALPVTLGGAADGRMLFRSTPGFCPAAPVPGRFGIAEPPDTPDFSSLSPTELDGALILVPGLGFDDDGFRIGYGGGYYDRFLSALARDGVTVCTVGLCPAVCRVTRLPRAAHDRRVDVVLSDH